MYLLQSLTDASSLISRRLLASGKRQFMFSMGQSGALVVVGLAVVVVPFAVVPPAVVDFMVVVAPDPPPPPPIGMQASDCRMAAKAIKMVNL